jgi:hypothetical protein
MTRLGIERLNVTQIVGQRAKNVYLKVPKQLQRASTATKKRLVRDKFARHIV